MSAAGEVLVGVVMLVGLVGVVVPVLPGGVLILGAGVVWALLDGGGAARWTVVGLMALVLAVGTVLQYALAGRSASRGGASTPAIVGGALLGLVGLFVVPVVGLPLGFVLGVFLVELGMRRDVRPAWQATVAAIRAAGLSLLVQLTAAVLMVGLYGAGLLLT